MANKLSNEDNEMTMHEIRVEIGRTIRDLRSKAISPASANAIANQFGKYLGTIKVELEYARALGRVANIPALLAGIGPGEGAKGAAEAPKG